MILVKRNKTILLTCLVLSLIIYSSGCSNNQTQNSCAKPKAIKLDTDGKDYLNILGGPPESIKMRAGLVVLQPNKTVGKHSTEKYEELIVVLEGKGEMIINNSEKMEMESGYAYYCPPNTEHDIANTDSTQLRYIYVVSKTE